MNDYEFGNYLRGQENRPLVPTENRPLVPTVS